MYPQAFGKYVLERELSRGGMARVVLATLRGAGGFEKRLVVKQIRDELAFDHQFVRRFVEEAKTTVALSHPNIVPVYELGVEQGTYFLAMELVEGVSVAELLRERTADGERRVLTPDEGAYIGVEVCRALDYAHRRMKVVHRDITPRNVMIDEEGQIKLIDFGIAAPSLVSGHEILGSPGHMPPEQVEGGELGPPTDIFALAVLLMEAWSGVAPFRRATPEESEEAMRGPHPRPSDFDPRLIPLDEPILRAMRLDPRERQEDAAELGRALRAFLHDMDNEDIARALGDRVRELREAASEPSPPSTAPGARPQQASASEIGTKTFAARDEALRWSTPPESDEPGAASTRRLRDSSPPAYEIVARPARPRRAPARKPEDPAMSVPTPLMVEPVGELAPADDPPRAVPAAGQPAERPAARPAERVETIATRPLEAPVRRKSAPPAAPAPRRRAIAAGAAVAAVAGLAFLAWRSGAPDVEAPVATPSPPASVTAASAVPAASSAPIVAVKATTAPSVAPSDVPSDTPAPPDEPTSAPPHVARATTSHASASPAAAKSGRASVMLLGDPGTRVSIDGATRGACPVRVTLEPGQHEARFTFEPTGESRGERFSVKSGDRITVRAEFTGATPTVRIHR